MQHQQVLHTRSMHSAGAVAHAPTHKLRLPRFGQAVGRLCCCTVQARASNKAGRTGGTSLRPFDRQRSYRGLLGALVTQFREESWPWIWELLSPVLAGPPRPLTDTVDPRTLADTNSHFTEVSGISIHYKEYIGGQADDNAADPEAQAAAPAAAATSDFNPDSDGVPPVATPPSPAQLPTTSLVQPAGAPAPAGPNILMLHGFNGSEFNWRLVAQPLADFVTEGAQAALDATSTAPSQTSNSNDISNGNGNGTGNGTGRVQVQQQQQKAAAPCRAVAYDRPPFGLSGRPLNWSGGPETDPYTVLGGVAVAAGLIRQLGLGPVVVMGHSAGAPIALELAIRHPELVSGVVLVSPAISTSSKGPLASADLGRLLRFAYTRALLSNDALGLNYVRQMIRKREAEVRQGKLGVYHDDTKFFEPEVIEGFLRPLRAHDWDRASLAMFRSFSVTATATRWQDVKAPVLVVQGDVDGAVPPSMARAVVQRLQDAGCQAQYVELSQCGHLPMEERPQEFVDAVADFMARCLRRPPRRRGANTVLRSTAARQERLPHAAAGLGAAGGAELLGSMQDAVDPVRQQGHTHMQG